MEIAKNSKDIFIKLGIVVGVALLVALIISFTALVCIGILSLLVIGGIIDNIIYQKNKHKNKIIKLGDEKYADLINTYDLVQERYYSYINNKSLAKYLKLQRAQIDYNNKIDEINNKKGSLTAKDRRFLEKYSKNNRYFVKKEVIKDQSAEVQVKKIREVQSQLNVINFNPGNYDSVQHKFAKKAQAEISNLLNNSQIPNYYPMLSITGNDLKVMRDPKITTLKKLDVKAPQQEIQSVETRQELVAER